VTRYVIPEVCGNIAYSTVSAKRDAFRDASSICKTRVTSVTVMDIPYAVCSVSSMLCEPSIKKYYVTDQFHRLING
jgi:hypothetical protein